MKKPKPVSKMSVLFSFLGILLFIYYSIGSAVGMVITFYQIVKPPTELIQLVLDTDWKLTSAHQDSNGNEIKVYIRNSGKLNQEQITETTQTLNTSQRLTRTQNIQIAYQKSQDNLRQLNCTTKPAASLPSLHIGVTYSTGVLFACPNSKETGMTFIFNDDDQHISVIYYTLKNSYPMTPDVEKKILAHRTNIKTCRYRDMGTVGDRYFHLLGWDYMAGNGYMCQ